MKRLSKIILTAIFFFLIFSCKDNVREDSVIYGKAVSIIDGDTFDLLVKNEKIRIRLSAIDCPERGQPYYKNAKQYLAVQIFQKDVKVKLYNKDSFGKRWIGEVFLSDTISVNKLLIENGFAWHFIKYSSDKELGKLQEYAMQRKVNIWSDSNAVAPWNFRKIKKRKNG